MRRSSLAVPLSLLLVTGCASQRGGFGGEFRFWATPSETLVSRNARPDPETDLYSEQNRTIRLDAAVNETVIYGMGEFHLRVLLERMSERYGVRVKTHPPSIPYRETITRPAEGHCRP